MANRNKIDLSGQCGIVTGAAAGLGFGIAQRLVESGARIALWDVNPKALDEAVAKLGKDKVIGVVGNIADAKSVEDGVGATMKAFGSIDICVNNAGISGPNVVTWEYPIDAWKQVVDINLTCVSGQLGCGIFKMVDFALEIQGQFIQRQIQVIGFCVLSVKINAAV